MKADTIPANETPASKIRVITGPRFFEKKEKNFMVLPRIHLRLFAAK